MLEDRPPSREEEVLRERNTKKVKGGEHPFSNDSTVPIDYSNLFEDMKKEEQPRRSYKETVLGSPAKVTVWPANHQGVRTLLTMPSTTLGT